MGAISHKRIEVDREAGPAHAPTILLLPGFQSSSSTGHFALDTAASEIAHFADDFLSDTTQSH
jgi:hypothetical protein